MGLPTQYQEFIYKSRYAKWLDKKNRRENINESADRYVNFFRGWLKKKFNYDVTDEESSQIVDGILSLGSMPSMRAFMTAGPALARDHVAGYNPVSGNTKVLTKEFGLKKISELSGNTYTVLNKDGVWTDGKFRSYGKQKLYDVCFRLNSNTEVSVECTKNHRWVLKSGEVKSTETLSVGDKVDFVSAIKDVDESSIDYRRGIQHGIIYGDGTATYSCERVKGYHIRICSDVEDTLKWFEEYPVCYPPSAGGDPVVQMYDGFAKTHSLKDLPSHCETDDYLIGFFRGWLAADGYVCSRSATTSICTSNEGVDWLENVASKVGFVAQSKYKLQSETNYGKRNKDSYIVKICRSSLSKYDHIISRKRKKHRDLESKFIVKSVEPLGFSDEVFCAEVDDTNTFVLSHGLVTGNCSYQAAKKTKMFDELLYILMCGTGKGFSNERQYIQKLPEIPEKLYETDSVIVVQDSKIGWAKAYKEMLGMLYSGNIPKWDISKVRPAGSRLKTFGGRSSGPEPLVELFEFTINTFKSAAGRALNSIEVHDIICYVANIVVVGGVRRAALIGLSNLSDDRMRHAKSGQWWVENPQRALANNSIAYTEKPDMDTFMREWYALYESKSGERGIFNRQAAKKQVKRSNDLRKEWFGDKARLRDASYDFGANPCCFTGDMRLLTSEGYKRFDELCELDEVGIVNNDGNITKGKVWCSGVKDTVEVCFSENTNIRCTPDHLFMLSDGTECQAQDLTGKRVQVYNNYYHGNVVDVKELEPAEVFDFTEPENHWGVVEGVVVHNSEIILRDEEFCNLSEAVVRKTDTLESLKLKLSTATLVGTWQSTLTDFRYLSSNWKNNCEDERLLGVSLTGEMSHYVLSGQADRDNGVSVLDEESQIAKILMELRKHVVSENMRFADKLGINYSSATTCVKPSGTVSQLVNSSSGLHAWHNDYYIRTVRADKKDPLAQFMVDKGFPCEDDVSNPHNMVFSFPMRSEEGAITRNDLTAIEQLEIWLCYQRFWCEHKPSVTINVRDHEWMEVGAWVWKYFDEISGVSFLPYSDHTYKQAPYQDCTKEQYEELAAKIPQDVNWDDVAKYEIEDNTTGSQELACSAGVCEIVDITSK